MTKPSEAAREYAEKLDTATPSDSMHSGKQIAEAFDAGTEHGAKAERERILKAFREWLVEWGECLIHLDVVQIEKIIEGGE